MCVPDTVCQDSFGDSWEHAPGRDLFSPVQHKEPGVAGICSLQGSQRGDHFLGVPPPSPASIDHVSALAPRGPPVPPAPVHPTRSESSSAWESELRRTKRTAGYLLTGSGRREVQEGGLVEGAATWQARLARAPCPHHPHLPSHVPAARGPGDRLPSHCTPGYPPSPTVGPFRGREMDRGGGIPSGWEAPEPGTCALLVLQARPGVHGLGHSRCCSTYTQTEARRSQGSARPAAQDPPRHREGTGQPQAPAST